MAATLGQQVCYMKDSALWGASTSEEETATQTPRSVSNSLNDESLVETPRDSAKSAYPGNDADVDDSNDDKEEDEDNNSYEQDEYYAFLREFAGSFEATEEDDESESGDEDGEKEDRLSERKRSSSTHVGPFCGPTSGCTPACQGRAGLASSNKKDLQKTMLQAHGSSSPSKPLPGLKETEPSGSPAGRWKPRTLRRSSSTCSEVSSCSSKDDLDDGSSDSETDERRLVPTPNHDRRGPVQDDYDVVQAVLEYSRQRSGDANKQRCEDLKAEIGLKRSQVERLRRLVESPLTRPDMRKHYARVCQDITREAKAFETELKSLAPVKA